ncbi:MAG: branched-chain amino acid ABC transporter permease, partial [Burkholderiales bacterium]
MAHVGALASVDASLARPVRLRGWELALWAAMAALAVALPQYALLVNEIAILALFALSLDLVLGYAGIVSLGHAAFFGLGAYAAALFAKHLHPDPLTGLAVATAICAVFGAACSATVVRGTDLTRLMVTLGIALVLYELANRFDGVTGGADGLQGVVMGPVLGLFDFDLGGRVASGYSFAALFVAFVIVRRIVLSPFGWSLQALRDNRLRVGAIGLSVNARLAAAYTLGAALAGASGALLAQTNGFVSLDVLDFHRSADVLLVLVIGGAGWLYGGLVGAVVFKLMYDFLS